MLTRNWLLWTVLLLSLALTCGQGCPDMTVNFDGITGPSDSFDEGDELEDDGDDGDIDDGDGEDADDCGDASAAALALFDEVWNTFDQKYSYFTHKGIDWSDVRSRYRCDFAQDLSPADFAARLNDMLQELHDWHVNVFPPEGDALGYNGQVVTNFPPTLLTSYTQEGAYTKLGNDVIFHATVGNNIAHIVVDTLDTSAFNSVSDDDIENLFTTYASADGMIIDIRNNNGGNENNAIKIASRFINQPVVYGYVATRNGPGHDDFDPLVTKTLQPSSATHFNGPVVCLIGQRCLSSAEWFTLMMRAAGATLIGDRTRGGSGNPETFTLSNGVGYRLSRWVAYTPDMEIFEDHGISPDSALHPGQGPDNSFDDTHDYVLERALELLEPAS